MNRKDAIIARIRAIKAERTSLSERLAAKTAALGEATESMRTVANLFSASVWAILPQRIKAYFEPYREV